MAGLPGHDRIGPVAVLEALFGAQPVAFSGGPLDRQVHAWSMADVAANEAVWAGDDRAGGYVRSPTWRTQQRRHRPVTYKWIALQAHDYADMPTLAIPYEAASRD
jgi:hypothetical protein